MSNDKSFIEPDKVAPLIHPLIISYLEQTFRDRLPTAGGLSNFKLEITIGHQEVIAHLRSLAAQAEEQSGSF
jgi:hypothetical protein